MPISAGFGAIPFKWRVRPPNGEMERYEIDAPRMGRRANRNQCSLRLETNGRESPYPRLLDERLCLGPVNTFGGTRRSEQS